MKKQSPTTSKILSERRNAGCGSCRSYARETCCADCEVPLDLAPQCLHSAITPCIANERRTLLKPSHPEAPLANPDAASSTNQSAVDLAARIHKRRNNKILPLSPCPAS